MLAQLGDRGHAEQLHRGPELAGQQVERPVHAGLAAGHQPVQVGPAEHGRVRAEGERDRHVRAVPTPESTSSVNDGPTASRTGAIRSTGATARSSCRPPWLDSWSPSTPSSTARRASAGPSGPLSSSLPAHLDAQVLDVRPVQVGVEEVRRLPSPSSARRRRSWRSPAPARTAAGTSSPGVDGHRTPPCTG